MKLEYSDDGTKIKDTQEVNSHTRRVTEMIIRVDSRKYIEFLGFEDLIEDVHNSWLYCFTNPFKLGTRVSLSHRQPYVYTVDDAICETI